MEQITTITSRTALPAIPAHIIPQSEYVDMREGVRYFPETGKYYFERTDKEQGFYFNSPHEAFAALIDKVSGKGTWDMNPFVVVYCG